METTVNLLECLTDLSLSEKMTKKRELFEPDEYTWNAIERQDISTLSKIDPKTIIKNIGIMLFYMPNDFYKDTREKHISHELAKTKIADKLNFISNFLDSTSLKKAIGVEKTLESSLCDYVVPSIKIEKLINTDDTNLFNEPHDNIIHTLLISNRIPSEKRTEIFYRLDPEEQGCAKCEAEWLISKRIDRLCIEIEIGKGDLIEEDSNYSDFLVNALSA